MRRDTHKIFSEGKIGELSLPNRLIRSATWDPSIVFNRKMNEDVLGVYRELAAGGVGLIITGGLTVYRHVFPGEEAKKERFTFDELQVEGIHKLAQAAHKSGTGCKIIAQLEVGYLEAGPSELSSPFDESGSRALTVQEIHEIINSFVAAIVQIKAAGFDGVQLHAAHGGLLSRFLSPYTNRRDDLYGGTLKKCVQIVSAIVSLARAQVGSYPILIKMNATDYLPGGIDIHSFPELAKEIERIGVDAIEVSGGMWECLVRSEEELGFRPVPAPESHTRIRRAERQSYFLEYARQLALDIPVILVGGNRDVERLEAILRRDEADFIALCRPLIREPDLPNRWREGRGSSAAECVSCNSCLYKMYVHPGKEEPGLVTCVSRSDKGMHKQAQKWLNSWVKENTNTQSASGR